MDDNSEVRITLLNTCFYDTLSFLFNIMSFTEEHFYQHLYPSLCDRIALYMTLATKQFKESPSFRMDEDLFICSLLKLLTNSNNQVVLNTFESLINMMRVD